MSDSMIIRSLTNKEQSLITICLKRDNEKMIQTDQIKE